MLVRIIGSVSGTRDGEDWPPVGDLRDWPDEECIGYLNNGLVEAVSDAPKVEAATEDKKPRKRTGLTKESTGL